MLHFFELHYPQSLYNGRVQIGCRGKNKTAIIPAMTVDINALAEVLPLFRFHSTCDYYITANGVSGVHRKADALFSIHNMVIDIDCHETFSKIKKHDTYLRDIAIENLMFRLNHEILGFSVASPSSIVFTGRGVQLWWAFSSNSSIMKSFYDELLNFYIEKISEVITTSVFTDLSMFKLDLSASKNAVGYFRIPSTINQRAKRKVQYQTTGISYVLMDLVEKMKKDKEENVDMVEKGEKTYKFTRDDYVDFTDFLYKRAKSIELLRDIRNAPEGQEERNNFCFMLFNTLCPIMGKESALARVETFNKGFKVPLLPMELHNTLVTAIHKGGYHYSREKMMVFLGVTMVEAEQVGFYDEKYNTIKTSDVARVQKYLEKKERDKQIIKAFKNGDSQACISKNTGVSVPTIRKVLRAHDLSADQRYKEDAEILRESIIDAIISGGLEISSYAIAKKMGVSGHYVRKVRKQLYEVV